MEKDFTGSMKKFAESQEKFLIGDWLRSLETDEIEYLLALGEGSKLHETLVKINLAAIVLENPIQTGEIRMEIKKIEEIYRNMIIFLGFELTSRVDPKVAFKPLSIFAEGIEVYNPNFVSEKHSLFC